MGPPGLNLPPTRPASLAEKQVVPRAGTYSRVNTVMKVCFYELVRPGMAAGRHGSVDAPRAGKRGPADGPQGLSGSSVNPRLRILNCQAINKQKKLQQTLAVPCSPCIVGAPARMLTSCPASFAPTRGQRGTHVGPWPTTQPPAAQTLRDLQPSRGPLARATGFSNGLYTTLPSAFAVTSAMMMASRPSASSTRRRWLGVDRMCGWCSRNQSSAPHLTRSLGLGS